MLARALGSVPTLAALPGVFCQPPVADMPRLSVTVEPLAVICGTPAAERVAAFQSVRLVLPAVDGV